MTAKGITAVMKQRVRPQSLLYYWKDGNTPVPVALDPPSIEEARPFHIVIAAPGWIPISILVFARDADHARSRLRASLVECRDKEYKRSEDHADRRDRVQKFIDALDGKGGELQSDVQPYDVGLMAAKVNWAGNGGLL